MAPNVGGGGAPGRRTAYSLCGMCAVRCPIEVTVEDGRVVWLQGNPHDEAIGTSLCAKGSAGLAFGGRGTGGVLCLTRVGGGGLPGYAVADVAAKVVLKNNVLVGSVNANKRHWYKASQALQRTPDDIKVVIQFSEA
jgi:hypothetical protein